MEVPWWVECQGGMGDGYARPDWACRARVLGREASKKWPLLLQSLVESNIRKKSGRYDELGFTVLTIHRM